MGYTRMDPAQLIEFLTTPVRPGVLGTTRANGRPHLAPVWYVLDGPDTVYFNTGSDTIKGRTLRRTGWAALTVQDDRPPFSYATVSGPVELIDDLEQVREWAAVLGGRYMGADRAAEYGARNAVPGELLCRLRIEQRYGVLDVAH